jgi:hypothetical protein
MLTCGLGVRRQGLEPRTRWVWVMICGRQLVLAGTAGDLHGRRAGPVVVCGCPAVICGPFMGVKRGDDQGIRKISKGFLTLPGSEPEPQRPCQDRGIDNTTNFSKSGSGPDKRR